MIELKGVSRRYGSVSILRDLDLTVQAGECLVILGCNGAGKTTLMRIISSLIIPHSGVVRVAGYLFPEKSDLAREKIGVVLHETMLYDELSAIENLQYYSQLYLKSISLSSVNAVLEQVGLSGTGEKKVKTFSRGMKQRLTIARALIHDPQVLLLDEPFTALDESGCSMVNETVKQYIRNGRCVVITSHDLNRLEGTASRYAILDKGMIQKDIYSADLSPDTASSWYQKYTLATDMTK